MTGVVWAGSIAALGQAFDEAWGTIESNFCGDLRDIEKARYRLATALLSVASDDSRDVELLKRSALEAMALAYRDKLSLISSSRADRRGGMLRELRGALRLAPES